MVKPYYSNWGRWSDWLYAMSFWFSIHNEWPMFFKAFVGSLLFAMVDTWLERKGRHGSAT